MAIDDDEELLQDFLVEAGEILEQLNEQLVDLEQRPDDSELLNAVFRGFHTIKGGAGFLGLDALVALCHRAEDVFNALRNGERAVDAQLMDIILPVLDVVNIQFDEIRSGSEPTPAEPELLQQLDALLDPNIEVPVAAPIVAQEVEVVEKNEKLNVPVEALEPNPANTDAANDEITEEEFEALLDQLHGSGKKDDQPINVPVATFGSDSVQEEIKPDSSVNKNDEITEKEFDALLDQLHGSGKSITPKQSKIELKPEEEPCKAISEESVSEKATVEKIAEAPSKKETADNVVTKIAKNKEQPAQQLAETTVRVDTKRLDDIMNMVGELVLVRNRVTTLGLAAHNDEMATVVANLDVVTADLQSAVMKTRMQPIKKVFGRFPRVVRDLARNMKKEINLEMQGEDTDLDKNLVEALADPLVHLVRNAVDHGIEMPVDREANDKSRVGTVILTAEQEGDHILLMIQDDGKGMDPEVLRRIAVTKGLMDEEAASRLEEKDCFNLIFAPGFSSKEEISDVSGRGVGMDVVKTRIEQLNGTVEIDSELGRGSIIKIQVPLTLAIMPTLMVMLDDQVFALPLASVNEIFHLDLTHTNVIDGQLVVMVRHKALPLFYLRHWLISGADQDELPEEGHVVVVSIGAQRVGFVVDQLIGQEEVVIKPLGALLHGMRGLAGATITGNGRISLILDIPGIMQTYARRL